MLVRVIACGVNPADPLIVSGKYAKEFGTHLPLVPGYDVAGVVEKVGAKVTNLKVGDGVYGYALFGGGWAEYAVLAENEAALKPKSLTFVEAAAVPLAALTAWQALIDVAQLSAGQTALIMRFGESQFACDRQVARPLVIATASLQLRPSQQLGADGHRLHENEVRRGRERGRCRARSRGSRHAGALLCRREKRGHHRDPRRAVRSSAARQIWNPRSLDFGEAGCE